MRTGDVIRLRREKLGLTQKEVADQLGLETPMFLSLVENHKRNVPIGMVAKLCDVLDLERIYIIGCLVKEYRETLKKRILK